MSEKSRQEILEKAQYWARTGGHEFLLKLVDVYSAEASKCLAALRQAFERGNEAEFTRAAHTLKSSSANVGAATFSNLAKKIELASRAGRMADLAPEVQQLEDGYKHVSATLEYLRVKPVAELLSSSGDPI